MKTPFWLDDYGGRVHAESHVYLKCSNYLSICRYGILAFGSMMCIDRVFNHYVQYLIQCGGTQLYL